MNRLVLTAVALFCSLGAVGPVALAADAASVTASPPAAPSDLTATLVDPGYAFLSWTDNADDEGGYYIGRDGGLCSPCYDGEYPPDTTSHLDGPLAPETTYTYHVYAYNESGPSVPAEAVITTPPAMPWNLTATAVAPDQIDLAWEDMSWAENGFTIERCAGSACVDFVEIIRLGANATSYSDTGLDVGTTHRYRVRAFNYDGYSYYSYEAEATTPPVPPPPPAAPSGLTATAVSPTQVNLAWEDNAGDEDGFRIERCVGGGCADFVEIAQVGANVTSYGNTGLSANTTYRYRVRAFHQAGYSGYSNEAEATTPLPSPPAPPSSLTVTGVTKTSVTLAWTDNSGNEDGFRVYRCTGSTCTPMTLVAALGPNSQSYTNTGLLRRTTYRYRVTAYNGSGESAPSNTVTVRTRN